ncbi:GIY-YIG nuclease family protein, partial [bacterium]|nr:GIY-YIG nuclease family protein [bacterium]
KAGRFKSLATTQRTATTWEDVDRYLFASEIAWQTMLNDDLADSLDEILCDPQLAAEFDRIARRFAPGFKPFQYRWAALKLRKEAKSARIRSAVLDAPGRLSRRMAIGELDTKSIPSEAGLYVISQSEKSKLYVGETLDLRRRFAAAQQKAWGSFSEDVFVQTIRMDPCGPGRLAWQSCLVQKFKPTLNSFELRPQA